MESSRYPLRLTSSSASPCPRRPACASYSSTFSKSQDISSEHDLENHRPADCEGGLTEAGLARAWLCAADCVGPGTRLRGTDTREAPGRRRSETDHYSAGERRVCGRKCVRTVALRVPVPVHAGPCPCNRIPISQKKKDSSITSNDRLLATRGRLLREL